MNGTCNTLTWTNIDNFSLVNVNFFWSAESDRSSLNFAVRGEKTCIQSFCYLGATELWSLPRRLPNFWPDFSMPFSLDRWKSQLVLNLQNFVDNDKYLTECDGKPSRVNSWRQKHSIFLHFFFHIIILSPVLPFFVFNFSFLSIFLLAIKLEMRLIDRRDEADQELDFKRIRRLQTSSPRWHVIIVEVIEKLIARYGFASERIYILLSEEAVIVAAVAFFINWIR